MKTYIEFINEQNGLRGRFNILVIEKKLALMRKISPIDDAITYYARRCEIFNLQLQIIREANVQSIGNVDAFISRYQQMLVEKMEEFAESYTYLFEKGDFYDADFHQLLDVASHKEMLLGKFKEKLAREYLEYKDFSLESTSDLRLLEMNLQKRIELIMEHCEALITFKQEIVMEYERVKANFFQQMQSSLEAHRQQSEIGLVEEQKRNKIIDIMRSDNLEELKKYLEQFAPKGISSFFKSQRELMSAVINDIVDDANNTLLHLACHYGAVFIVQFLLQLQAKPEVRNRVDESGDGYYPIHEVLILEMPREMLEKLIAAGKIHEIENYFMDLARKKLTILEAMFTAYPIKIRDMVNTTGYLGRQPLHTAAWFGNAVGATWLITHGANIDATNDPQYSETPLHVAVSKNRYDVADVLLLHGANPRLPDAKGFTPLVIALMNSDEQMIAVFLKRKVWLTKGEWISIGTLLHGVKDQILDFIIRCEKIYADAIAAVVNIDDSEREELAKIKRELLCSKKIVIDCGVKQLPNFPDLPQEYNSALSKQYGLAAECAAAPASGSGDTVIASPAQPPMATSEQTGSIPLFPPSSQPRAATIASTGLFAPPTQSVLPGNIVTSTDGNAPQPGIPDHF